ncbi:putative sugar kinase [Bacillus sp. TS-2]|nr:putative sugar kinase [Bacillus sp. TS-2]
MDVITMGETMVLFTPTKEGMLRYANQFEKTYGGAEMNVAIALARLNHEVAWISKVGNDEFGKGITAYIRGEGVDTSQVLADEEAPTGVFFKEIRRADDMRIHYYRKGSAASKLNATDVNEDFVSKAKYVHISGITPALSDSAEEAIWQLISIAKKHEIPIVFDPNVRKKLWSESKARQVLTDIAKEATIVMPGVAEGKFLFNEDDPKKIAEKFIENGAKLVITKVGADGAYYTSKDEHVHVPGIKVDRVVDPVGAGDGFAAGFLSGQLDSLSVYESVKRANLVGALATMVKGDVEGMPEKEELLKYSQDTFEDVSR